MVVAAPASSWRKIGAGDSLAAMLDEDHKVLEIRQANESDICDLAVLDDECFDTYYYEKTKFSESDFQAYLGRRKALLLVAVRDSCLVGYVAGTTRVSRSRSMAHIDSIAVCSADRNKGIGSRLLDLFIQEARQGACAMVLLEVAEANKEGLEFFSKRGFQRIDDLPEYYGRGLDGVLMQLRM
jgi:ribosomal-protein-alanine N-acetyltransferase